MACLSFNEYVQFLKTTLANTGITCPSIVLESTIKKIINTNLSGVRILHVKNTATSKIDTYVDLTSSKVAGLINNIGGNPFHLKVCCYGLTCLKPVGHINFNDILTKTYRCGKNSVENDTNQLNTIINTGSSYWYKSLENNNLNLPGLINLANGQPLTALDDIFQNNRTNPTISSQYVECTDGTCIQDEMLGGTNTTWLYWLAEFSGDAQILMSPLYADLVQLDAFYEKCEDLTDACSRATDKCSWRLENLKDYLPKALSKYSEIEDCLQYYKDPDAEPKNPGKIWSHMLTEDCYNIYRSMRDTYGLKNFVITEGLMTWFQGLRAQLEDSLGDNSVIGTLDACKRCAGDEKCLKSCLKANEALEECFEKCTNPSYVSECENQCRMDCNTICGDDAGCLYACEGGEELDECKDFMGCAGSYINVTGGPDVCASDEYNADDIDFKPNTDICTIDPVVFRVAPCVDSDGDGIIVTRKKGKTSANKPSDDDCRSEDWTTEVTEGKLEQIKGECACKWSGDSVGRVVDSGTATCCKIDAYDPQSGGSEKKITLEKLATKDNCVVTSEPPLDDSSSYPNYKSITFSCKISDDIACNC